MHQGWSLTRELTVTRKNSAYWQENTSGLFSYTRLIQVPGCRVTRSADHLSLVFSPEKSRSHQTSPEVLARVKVHLQFCSHLIHLTPKNLFPIEAKGTGRNVSFYRESFQIFYYNWGKENRENRQGIRHTEVRYIAVQLGSSKQQLNNWSLCIEVPTTEYYCVIYRSFFNIFFCV